MPKLNDVGDVAWVRYDFCSDPWLSYVRVHQGGTTTQLTADGTTQPQSPSINMAGIVAWADKPAPGKRQIWIWEDGVTTLFTSSGAAPMLNDRGDVAFSRWDDSLGVYQAWLSRAGAFYQLTAETYLNFADDINELGEVPIESGYYPNTQIRLFQRFDLGDLNCDGSVNGFDVEPFVTALTDATLYTSEHPNCDPTLADTNADGSVNGFDVDRFVAILTGSG